MQVNCSESNKLLRKDVLKTTPAKDEKAITFNLSDSRTLWKKCQRFELTLWIKNVTVSIVWIMKNILKFQQILRHQNFWSEVFFYGWNKMWYFKMYNLVKQRTHLFSLETLTIRQKGDWLLSNPLRLQYEHYYIYLYVTGRM